MIPTHLADATTHNGISRRAKPRACPTCGAAILVGLDDPRCAGEARVDFAILTPLGEVAALLGGRATYRLRTIGRLELDARSRWHIAGASAAAVDVVAEHRCHAPPLPSRQRPEDTTTQEESNAIPY